MEDSQEDLDRKFEFWECLDSIIDDNKSSKFILHGDLSARLSTSLDSDQSHIGPHVWWKRQSILDPDRDNAEYLFSFLQGRDLFLPQTNIDLQPFFRRALPAALGFALPLEGRIIRVAQVTGGGAQSCATGGGWPFDAQLGRVDGEWDPGACALPRALSTSGGILREAC